MNINNGPVVPHCNVGPTPPERDWKWLRTLGEYGSNLQMNSDFFYCSQAEFSVELLQNILPLCAVAPLQQLVD